MDNLIIIGAGGHGRVVYEIAQLTKKYKSIFFLDDKIEKTFCETKVVGEVRDFVKYLDSSEFIVAIGDCNVRKEITLRLVKENAKLATIIHEKAIVSKSAVIDDGTVVMAGAIVNSNAKVGKAVIVNTGAIIEHDCVIKDYSHISVGAKIAGAVIVKEEVFVGVGAVVKNNVVICERTTIGAGAVVVKDIKKEGIYVGVPANKKA